MDGEWREVNPGRYRDQEPMLPFLDKESPTTSASLQEEKPAATPS